ncbi:MAG: hypothetical protein ABSB74_04105 [Tepidisphaeraceae bacterium]
MKGRRIQISVFLEPEVLQAARQLATDMKVSTSAAVAQAAKESLLSAYHSEREQEILKAVERNFHALRRLDQSLAMEIQVLKEMVGLGMRSFYNHIAPIPGTGKAAALLSGKQRFHGYLDMLAKNLRKGDSILSDVPLPEFDAPNESKAQRSDGASAKDAELANHIQREPSGPAADRGSAQPAQSDGAKHRQNWELFEPSEGA